MAAKRKTKLNLKPAAGYLIIEPVEPEKKTASGIYLPESSEEKPQQGKILAVGSDEVTESGVKRTSPVKVEDLVIYREWGGKEVKIEDKEYLLAKFEDILAVVK